MAFSFEPVIYFIDDETLPNKQTKIICQLQLCLVVLLLVTTHVAYYGL
jgi:hypothetical protein